MTKRNNTLTLDWFACTVKDMTPKNVIDDVLKMKSEDFAYNAWGINKYGCHYSYADICVYFPNTSSSEEHLEKMGVFVQLKGQGCSQYTEYMNSNDNNWVSLVKRFVSVNANFTRLDLANDIYDNSLSVQTVYEYVKKGLCVSSAKSYEYHEKGLLDSGEIVGETVNIGVKGGDGQQLGVYNKLMEQNQVGSSDIDSWVRCELRVFGEKANLIANEIAKERPLKSIFFESVNGHYRFVLDNVHSNDKNVRRRKPVKWWSDYIGTEKKTELKIVRDKRTMEKTRKFVDKQLAKSLAMLAQAEYEIKGDEGVENLINDLLLKGKQKITDKDWSMIEQCVKEQQSDENWGVAAPQKNK